MAIVLRQKTVPSIVLPAQYKTVTGMTYTVGTAMLVYHGYGSNGKLPTGVVKQNPIGVMMGFLENRNQIAVREMNTATGEIKVNRDDLPLHKVSEEFISYGHLVFRSIHEPHTRIVTAGTLERRLLV